MRRLVSTFVVYKHLKTGFLALRPTYDQKPPLNTHADVIRGAKGLNFGLSFYLPPYFVYVSSEGSGESAQPEPPLLDSARSAKSHVLPQLCFFHARKIFI